MIKHLNGESIDPGTAARSSFATILQWHLKCGTRPPGTIAPNRLVWTQKEFAYAVRQTGVNGETAERSVRNWCAGRTVPSDLTQIEQALFGPVPRNGTPDPYAEFRSRLRLAFRRAKGRIDPSIHPQLDRHAADATCTDPGKCFGRDREIARLASLLLSSQAGSILVLGNAGHGKTMLTRAVGVQPDVINHFGPRRWFVELERAESAAAALAEIAQAVGLERTEKWPAVQERLQGEHLPGLLLLDNLETPLHGPHQREPTEQLLRDLTAIPRLSLIASLRSQETVGSVAWTEELLLDPLAPEDAKAMFLSIARTLDPADPDLPFFVGKTGELAGIPLAIRLVAHRVFRNTTLAPLRREWRKQGALLAKLPGGDGARGDCLVASVEFSLRSKRLKPQGQKLFSLLGQLPAGLGEADGDALMGADGPEATAQLRSVGLLRDVDEARIGLLPPIRDIAARRFPPAPDLMAAWVEQYLRLLQAQAPRLGKAEGRAAMLRLSPEMPNIGAAMVASVHAGKGVNAALGILNLFEDATAYTGFAGDATLANLHAACVQTDDKVGQGKCLFVIADRARLRGENEAAKASFLAALECLAGSVEYRDTGLCHWGLAEIASIKGERELSKEFYRKARSCFELAGWRPGEANCISGLATIADLNDDYEAAVALYTEAGAIFKDSNSIRSYADCLWYIAEMERVRENDRKASQLFETARDIYIATGHLGAEADCLRALAYVAMAQGEFDAARDLLGKSRNIPRVDAAVAEVDFQLAMAELERHRGEISLAETAYNQALAGFESSEFIRGQAECLYGLAAIAQLRQDHATARSLYNCAIERYRRLGSLIGPANCLSALGDIASATDLDAAQRLNSEALDLYRRASAPRAAERCEAKFRMMVGAAGFEPTTPSPPD